MAATTPFPCEENVYMAKLAEQAERYEEMVEFVEMVIGAYKNVIDAHRASWYIISFIEQEENRGNDDHVATIRDYQSKIETELSNIYDGILKLLDSRFIPSAIDGDSKVFYLKMKGGYHCYLAEFKTSAECNEAAEFICRYYR